MRGMGGGGSGGGADGPHCGDTVLLSASKAVSFCGLRTQKACHPSPLASMVSSLSHLHTARRWRVRVQLQRVHSLLWAHGKGWLSLEASRELVRAARAASHL